MNAIWAPVLAALTAFAVVILELLTSKYPRTLFLVGRSRNLYIYGAIYGAIAAAICYFLPADAGSAVVGVSNVWIRAVGIGFAVKAFMHIRLFSVPSGPGKTVPVGVETVVQLFEPLLLDNIDLDHFALLREFLRGRALKYPTADAARNLALQQIPPGFSDDTKAAMTLDLNKADTSEKVLRIYLTYAGRKAFDATFS